MRGLALLWLVCAARAGEPVRADASVLVRDASGAAVARARVTLPTAPAVETFTDAKGRARVRLQPPPRLWVQPPAFAWEATLRVEASGFEAREVFLRLFQGARAEAVVVLRPPAPAPPQHAAPEPVAATLRLLDANGGRARGYRVGLGVEWGGSVRVDGLERRDLVYRELRDVGADGVVALPASERTVLLFSPEGVAQPLFFGPLAGRRFVVKMPPLLRRLQGRVVDGAGEPVAGAEIRCIGFVRAFGEAVLSHAAAGPFRPYRTDDRGRFRVAVGAGVRPIFEVRAPGFAPAPLSRPTTTLEALAPAIDDGGPVRRFLLRVHDEEGRPVAGARVVADTRSQLEMDSDRLHTVVETDTRGVHLFVVGAGRQLRTEVRAPGYAPLPLELQLGGEDFQEMTVRLPAALRHAPLQIWVRDPEGAPLPGRVVQVRGADSTKFVARTDAEGVATFPRAPAAGTGCAAPEGLPGVGERFTFDGDDRAVFVDLRAFGSARVQLPADRPFVPVLVGESGRVVLEPAGDGVYRSARVPPGNYKIGVRGGPELVSLGARVVTARKESVIDLRDAGERVRAELGRPLVVTCRRAGRLVAGARLTLFDGTRALARDVSDADGQARFLLREGRHVVVARRPGECVGWISLEGAPGAVDLELVRARTLVVRAARATPSLRITDPLGHPLALALDLAGHEFSSWPGKLSGYRFPLRHERGEEWIAEDLPVGVTVVIDTDDASPPLPPFRIEDEAGLVLVQVRSRG